MDTATRTRYVRLIAADLIRDGERPTQATIARYTASNEAVGLMSDTAFSRFAAEVGREVAAQIRERADVDATLGR